MNANVRTFRAENPRAALAAVKAALGPEAVILATRELKGTLLTRGGIEVLAAPPTPNEPAPAANQASAASSSASVEPLGIDEKTEVMTRSDATRAMMARRSRAAFGNRRIKRKRADALFSSSDELADTFADNPFASPMIGGMGGMGGDSLLSPPEGGLILSGEGQPAMTGGQAELGEAPFEASFFAPPMGLDEAYNGLSDLDGLDGPDGPDGLGGLDGLDGLSDIDDDTLDELAQDLRDLDDPRVAVRASLSAGARAGELPEDDIADDAMDALAVALGVPLGATPVAPAPSSPARPASPRPPVAAAHVTRHLAARGVSEALAHQLIDAAGVGPDDSAEQLLLRVGRRVREHVAVARAPWSPDATGQRDVVALMGPTGVGKTTTIAKIAARAIMEFSLKVALITVDTYRIGAAHQLARYGELLGAPTFVARDRTGLSQAMERSRHADLVLIDTAGRSCAADVASQASLIQSIADVQMHLAISATSSRRHLARVKQRFAVADCERVIVTKLDEGDGPASFLDPVLRLGLPLSCVTMGQRVPEDIEALSPAAIVDRAVGA